MGRVLHRAVVTLIPRRRGVVAVLRAVRNCDVAVLPEKCSAGHWKICTCAVWKLQKSTQFKNTTINLSSASNAHQNAHV